MYEQKYALNFVITWMLYDGENNGNLYEKKLRKLINIHFWKIRVKN